ncbi:TPA: hypothetical protein DCW38_02585, partial [candidate division WOR-3 bacterium]|nr:hypothetical protein [candidate division WOR-3 bacterium]
IKDFLIKNKITFIEDETNNNEKFTRNRIRKNIIPVLNASIAGGLGKFKRFFENTDSVLMLFDFLIEDRLNIMKSKNPIILDISKILYYNNKLRKNLLYYILSKNLFVDSSLIESIDRVISSKRPNIIFKEKGMIIEKSYNDLKIEREAGDEFDKEDFLKPGMETLFNGYTLKITKTVFIESLLKKKNVFVFPLSAGRRFKIRTLQTSDSFVPFGMNKEKKVSRFLMDNKISLSERRRVPLILNEKDEILAVGSLRRTGLYRMKKQKGCLCIYVGKN